MKKLLTTTLILLSLLLTLGCAKKTSNSFVIATGGTSGSYHPLGNAIANIWNTSLENTSVAVQSTAGSVENVHLLNDLQVDYAIVQNDILDYAYHGKAMFSTSMQNLTVIGTLYTEVVQIATTRNADIYRIEDLRGKRVSVGEIGSGSEYNAKQLLESYGITFDDIQKTNLSYKEAAEGLQNETLDACFITAGLPNSALQELAFTTGLRMLPIDDSHAEKIMSAYSFYTRSTIPEETYSGVQTATPTLAVKATLAVSGTLPSDIVYNMTRTLFSNLDILSASHAKGKEITVQNAVTGVTIPFHAGAAQYYTELGVSVQ